MEHTGRASLWRDTDFQKWWWGQSVSLFGTQFTLLALPLVAAVSLRAGPAEMGLLGAAQSLPALAFGLVAGIWLDRVRRRPVMVVTQLVCAAALTSIPVGALLHLLSIGQLYVVALVTGTANTFGTIAQNAFLPALAGRENLVDANAKYQTSMTVASLAGPGAAGVAVQVLTAPVAIIVDALSFLVGAVTTAWVRTAEVAARGSEASRLGPEILEGLAFVATQPQVRAILLTLVLSNWGSAANSAVFVLLFVGRLEVTPAELGILFAAGSLFSLAGAQLTRRLVARVGVGPAMAGAALLFAAGNVASIPACYLSGTAAFAWLLATSVGFAGLMVYNVNQQAIRGSLTPDRLLGRANAAVYVTVFGGRVLFALAGGALGETVGLRGAYIAAALITGAAALPALLPALRRLRVIPATTDA